jgi:paraquat-inducible protein A
MRWILVGALVLAPLFFGLGIVLPLVRFETFYFFDRSPSLLGVVMALWTGQDMVLAVVVGLVSLVFPVVKMLAITAEALGRTSNSAFIAGVLPQLSRWSLMDVVLVALVIVAAKTGGFAEAFSQPGLWFYAGSALTAALAHGLAGPSAHGIGFVRRAGLAATGAARWGPRPAHDHRRIHLGTTGWSRTDVAEAARLFSNSSLITAQTAASGMRQCRYC